jgi:hypothetical protein
VNCGELAKIYHIETKTVKLLLLARITGKKSPRKISERSLNVNENTGRENAGFLPSGDIDENKRVKVTLWRCG